MGRCVGIELAPASVRALIAHAKRGDPVRVQAAREVPCDTANPDALTRALVQVRQALGVKAPVVLGVPSTAVLLSTISPLVVNAKRAAFAVQFELQQHLPFELADAAWDYQWLTNGSRPGRAPRGSVRASGGAPADRTQASAPKPALVAAMRRSLLEARVACCRRAGLAVRAVAITPVAALNAWRAGRRGEPQWPVVLLRCVDSVLAEWIVWTPASLQVLPISAASPQLLSQELAAGWDVLRSQLGEGLVTVRVLDGVAAPPQLAEGLSRLAGVRVETAELAPVPRGSGQHLERPERWAAAVGLVLQGAGRAALALNLIAETQRSEDAERMRRTASLASGICALGAFGLGLHGMLELRQRRLRFLESLERQEQRYQALRPEIRAALQRQENVEQRNRQFTDLGADTAALTGAVAGVTEALPDAIWLTRLEASRGDTIGVTLEGRAMSFQDVTQFFERLKAVAGMTGVKPLSTSVTTDPASGKELIAFSVEVSRALRPPPAEAEATAPTAAGTKTEAAPPARKAGRRRLTPRGRGGGDSP